MFTGIVQGIANVATIKQNADSRDISVVFPQLDGPAELGESIAIDGCCLTVTKIDGLVLTFQAGSETLAKTTLGDYQIGSQVNFERAMRMSDRLGGHIVSGHIDCVGTVRSRFDHEEWSDLSFQIPHAFLGQIVPKGSIAINGVSLTVVDVVDDWFSVALIPHTLAVTNIGKLTLGARVNLETDVIAKYVQRLLEFQSSKSTNQ